MSSNFFDKSILQQIESNEYPIVEKYENLKYYLKNENNIISFFIEIDDQRLNSSELKALLALNEKKKVLGTSDESLINYIANKLGEIQTIYKLSNDMQLVFDYLKDTKFEVFFNSKIVRFEKETLRLNLELKLDENSNIELVNNTEGDFLYGIDTVYYIQNNVIYTLNNKLPVRFYREIFEGNNKFTIDGFITLDNSFIETLRQTQNLNITQEVENIRNLELTEKIAPIVLEVNKTHHFINLELKYKIGDELFPVNDYKYFETSSWVDRDIMIKIVKTKTGLIKYISDIEMSEGIYDQILLKNRVKVNKNSKNPFQLMFSANSLNVIVHRILPELRQRFNIEYKDGQKLELNEENVSFELDTNLNSRLNLFEFKVRFKVKDEYFDLDFMKNLMLQNKKFVQLKDGSTANIENIREINKWIEFLNRFEFKKNGNLYKTSSSVALELDEFLKSIKEKTVKSNDEYRNIIRELKDKHPIEEVKLPSIVDNILREYQKEGVYWMYFLHKYGFGGILADEMGLGKTIQVLTILAMHRDDTHIVVCPKSLIYNWENECKKYFPDMKVLIIDKDSDKRKSLIKEASNYDLVITSYSMIQKDYQEYLDNKISFQYMILDEAHYVNNIKTLSSKAVRVVDARRRILLTGTPLENNLDELFGTFELVMPSYLGSKLEFRREFVSKIERNNTIALEILQSKIRPFILRRTKSQVLKELPEKQEQIVYNEMTNKQVGLYNEVLNRVKNEVEELVREQGFEKSRIQVLSALLKLRQICNHPKLLDKSFENEEDISGKYEQFIELLNEVTESGKKVLVFSQFTSMLDIFERDLEKMKTPFVRLDGSTKNRQEVVDRFNNDERIKVFLISLKAGGVGLNLTSASAVFLYDPWWNPMAEQQAVDRAHRIGQKNTVNIYKFITKNSIEEKILKLQERKGNMFENLVVEDNGFVKRLEWEDLMELFE